MNRTEADYIVEKLSKIISQWQSINDGILTEAQWRPLPKEYERTLRQAVRMNEIINETYQEYLEVKEQE